MATDSTFTLSLATSAVIDLILAESAMRHYLGADRPRPLTPDRRTALAPLVRAAWGDIAASLQPAVVEAEVSPDGEMLTLCLTGNSALAPAMLAALERLAARRVMAGVYASAGMAADARSATAEAEAALSALRLAAAAPAPPAATQVDASRV